MATLDAKAVVVGMIAKSFPEQHSSLTPEDTARCSRKSKAGDLPSLGFKMYCRAEL